MKNNVVRRQRERQELRMRMLDAARELFVNGGEEAVTLRKVAEKIEYSATTIYLHFPSKESLIHELCVADFELFSRSLKQAERLTDPMERLRKIALTYANFGLQHPCHYRSMFMSPNVAAVTSHPIPSTDRATGPGATQPIAYDFLYSAVFKAMAAGCFRSEYREVPLVAQVLWSGLHGVISLHLVRAGFPAVPWRSTQTTVEMMVELLVAGLTGKPPMEN